MNEANKIFRPLSSKHFQYLSNGLSWINANHIEVFCILSVEKYSEGITIIFYENIEELKK